MPVGYTHYKQTAPESLDDLVQAHPAYLGRIPNDPITGRNDWVALKLRRARQPLNFQRESAASILPPTQSRRAQTHHTAPGELTSVFGRAKRFRALRDPLQCRPSLPSNIREMFRALGRCSPEHLPLAWLRRSVTPCRTGTRPNERSADSCDM